jgi:hypothetical protein
MKTLTFITACLFSITCFGQTKLISFRSHSGSNANFRVAVERDIFDIGDSNFGNPPLQHIDKIDTIILKGNNKIIILGKAYNIYRQGNDKPHDIGYFRDTLTKAAYADFFLANNADSLKTDVRAMYRKRYRFVKLDSTLFIGFDKKFKQRRAAQKK